MGSNQLARIETLNKENYDTWKMQMEALLIKNDAWSYVNGAMVKPAVVVGDVESEAAAQQWARNDSKAKSDIILAINPSELKQIKGCGSSREVWLKLEGIYQSKGPARKATLLKQLTLQRMEESGDVREHIDMFFDAVDKLQEMEVEINRDLLAIMLLYSLPDSFENFRCAIESRDHLPTPDVLRVKIIEESNARKTAARGASQNALFSNHRANWRKKNVKKTERTTNGENSKSGTKNDCGNFKYRCYKCKEIGHKAADCKNKDFRASAKSAEDTCLSVSECHLTSSNKRNTWCLDSGATSHLCNDERAFSEMKSEPGKLNLANNCSTNITAQGKAMFTADVFGESKNISLSKTLLVPDLRTNLLSVGKITEKGCEVIFKRDNAFVVGNDGSVKLVADRIGELYYARERNKERSTGLVFAAGLPCTKTFEVWHRRLGHLNARDMSEAISKGTVLGLDVLKPMNFARDSIECEVCLQGKMVRTPFPKRSDRTSELLELIHSDVCGPMRVQSMSKARYFIEFIDDCSRWTVVRFLRSKSEAIEATKEFITMVENQQGKKIKTFQTDNGGEYTSEQFDNLLKGLGITRRFTIPHNPEQNGIAERKNRTLLDMARCLMLQSGLPPSFWAEAVNTANYIRNRCPSKSLGGRTPYEVWTGKKPNVSHFREFGCRVFRLDRQPNRGKFDSRAKEGVFLGYSEESKGYRVWMPNERKVEITRDVKFLEGTEKKAEIFTEFVPDDLFKGETDEVESPRYVGIEMRSAEEVENPEEEVQDEIEEEPVVRRERGRPRLVRTGARGRPRKVCRFQEARTAEIEAEAFISEIPARIAMNSPEVDEWYDAMAVEIRSIIKNNTWKLVKRPDDREVIGSRIVLRNKYNANGTLERRKARLVAQGFSQRPGVHFKETFAPVARLSSIRLLASIAAQYDMNIRQFDVTCAYLNGELEEEIFMEPPKYLLQVLEMIQSEEDREVGDKARKMLKQLREGDHVCLLKKSLYGLRQAGRSWYAKLDGILRRFGAVPTKADPCVYQIGTGEDSTLIAIYVDDIIVASRDPRMADRLFNCLSQKFETSDLGEIGYCLGMEFNRTLGAINILQTGYINELLKRFGMFDSKPVCAPLDPGVKLLKSEEPPDENLPYRELVGALTYLSTATRPDISFAVSYLGQFNNCYGKPHWTAAKRVLRYLKGTTKLGLTFFKKSQFLEGFVDADWGNCPNDRKSFTGYVFMLGGGPVSWDARKQKTVALSSTEAEYMGLAEATKEASYLRSFLIELGLDNLSSVVVYEDNLGALKLAANPTFHNRSKHIDIKYHFIRDAVKEKILSLSHVSSAEMVADVLTKGLPGSRHQRCVRELGLCRAAETYRD
jgi:hypothetical protein